LTHAYYLCNNGTCTKTDTPTDVDAIKISDNIETSDNTGSIRSIISSVLTHLSENRTKTEPEVITSAGIVLKYRAVR